MNDTQYAKDLLWTSKNDFRLNPNDFTNGDTQYIAQTADFYASAAHANQTKVQHIVYRTNDSTKEPRVEVDNNDRVKAWGGLLGTCRWCGLSI